MPYMAPHVHSNQEIGPWCAPKLRNWPRTWTQTDKLSMDMHPNQAIGSGQAPKSTDWPQVSLNHWTLLPWVVCGDLRSASQRGWTWDTHNSRWACYCWNTSPWLFCLSVWGYEEIKRALEHVLSMVVFPGQHKDSCCIAIMWQSITKSLACYKMETWWSHWLKVRTCSSRHVTPCTIKEAQEQQRCKWPCTA